MMLSSCSPSDQEALYSQHSRHPYNPFPRTAHQPQCPQYTLQAQTTPPSVIITTSANTTASSSPSLSISSDSSGSPSPPDMLFALESLLMGISPFPPTIPVLAKPTCPSLDDLTLPAQESTSDIAHNNFNNNNNDHDMDNDNKINNNNSKFIPSSPIALSSSLPLTPPSLSPSMSLSTHTQPTSTALSSELTFGHLDHRYRPTTISTTPPSAIHQASFSHYHQHRSASASLSSISSGSPTPLSPTPSSTKSASSPVYVPMESDHDFPYWSPSTPTLSMMTHHHRHHQQNSQQQQRWSVSSSPLMSPPHHQDSLSYSKDTSTAPTWGYSLFPAAEISRSGPDLHRRSSSSGSSNNSSHHVSFHHRPSASQSRSYNSSARGGNNNASYRSARHTSSSLSDVRAYESGIRHSYYSPRHYRTSTTLSSSSSPSGNHYTSNSNSRDHSSADANSNNHFQSGQDMNSSSNNDNNNNHGHRSHSNNGNNNNNNNNNNRPQQVSPTRGEPKSFPCQICTKPFPTRTQLKSHMAIHVDNFPFPCPYTGCDLHFKRKHDLRRHVDAKHALVKKYLCSGGCGEGFGRRDQMLRHLKRGNCQLKPKGDPARSVMLVNGGGDATARNATARSLSPSTSISLPPLSSVTAAAAAATSTTTTTTTVATNRSYQYSSQPLSQQHWRLNTQHLQHAPQQQHQQQQQHLHTMSLPPMSHPLS